ncbi:RidA family protein [Cuniculiplasma divulgatum]|uniref:Endoribonuclease L-PSP n=1 Tax=Cuniculiplasma divulgatum TaxID=1673428 RepID=A0A1N5V250_9ARCH|nr:RidA family protein [Cuniculiplasma divulgatum]SIM67084.1 endoribonuclease L-PSP [Cuniculiplasma divulgatum]
MDKKSVVVEELGRAGPYSHSVIANSMIFLSGQLGVKENSDNSFEQQFRRAASNVEKILDQSNSSMKNIVRVVVYMKNQGDFELMNKLFKEVFSIATPARTTVVCNFPNDKALIELEVTAVTQ